jgi:hypothetical protein
MLRQRPNIWFVGADIKPLLNPEADCIPGHTPDPKLRVRGMRQLPITAHWSTCSTCTFGCRRNAFS